MNERSALKSLGLELPSPACLIGAIIFGLIGWAAFRHRRKSGRRQTLWLGVALMACPYAISRTWLLYALGLALCAGPWVDRG